MVPALGEAGVGVVDVGGGGGGAGVLGLPPGPLTVTASLSETAQLTVGLGRSGHIDTTTHQPGY